MDLKGASKEASNGLENCIEQWMKGDPCYKVTENLAELFCVLWKVKV